MGKASFILSFTHAFVFMVPLILARTIQDEGSTLGANSTRRELHGGCEAFNKIDKCWRCKADWAENRQALADCALGFAKGTTGGKGGEIYEVTDPSDDDAVNPKPGTLRCGVTQDRPLWIIFKKDMVIKLKHELVITSDKTIDGRGACVQIANGAGLTVMKVKNVIIHGIHIHHIKETPGGIIKDSEKHSGPRAKSDGDGICIFGSCKVWVDHCTFDHGADGLVDVTMGGTDVTISNSIFNDHDKVMLLGVGNELEKNMKVTVAYNKFGSGCVQRLPRCRCGLTQVVNNDYNKWQMYAIGGTDKPTILSQGNRFVAPDNKQYKQVTRRAEATEAEWKTWNWKSEHDILLNGAFFIPSGGDVPTTPEMIPVETKIPVEKLTQCAGPLKCSPGKPC
ncbi:hypothetical protein LXL04_025206 [Taraxacum kok-saghyz]